MGCMNESRARLLSLKDQRIPALTSILGPGAVDMLSAAFEAGGGRVHSARLSQVSWTPGRSLNVVFAARVSSGLGLKPREERLVLAAGTSLPDGAVQLEDATGSRVAIWRLERDPALPGLATAFDPGAARGLLDGLDVPDGAVTPQLRAYRPGRRAVVELATRKSRVFVKAVPPAQIERLQAVHEQMSRHLPVPRSHGWSAEHGLVVLQALPGVSLRKCLLDGRLALPDPSQIVQMLDCIPAPDDRQAAPAQAEGAPGAAVLLRAIVPECTPFIDRLTQALDTDRPSEPLVPVHGDLHEAQMTVQGGTLAGLLDIDTAGLGERIDDWATLLGHLAVLRDALPAASARRIEPYARRLMSFADHDAAEPARLRLRIAAVILGMATGPFRVQSPAWVVDTRRRIELAGAWLESSREHANMKAFSDSSQASLIRA
jgi:hypothetical protein